MKPHPFPRLRPLPPLVWESDSGVLKLERRREKREHADGSLQASYSDGGTRFGIARLELVDRSDRGFGALTRAPIEPGMVVTIRPEGHNVAWVSAVAVRCEPEMGKVRVGLKLTQAAAA